MGAVVTPGYFEVLGMSLVRGRGLTREDRAEAAPVVVVNQTLARRLFGGIEAALGQRVRYSLDPRRRDLTVVGVVGDARTMTFRDPVLPTLYQPVAQSPDFLNSLEVRVSGDPAQVVDSVRAAVRAADARLPIVSMQTVRSQVDRSLAQERLLAALSSAFGLAALFLVAVGLYGVIAQWAAQRTREIGVRMALGATAGGVRWLVLRQGLALVIAGLAVGLPAALGASRLLQRMLFEVKPMDPGAVMLALSALGAVALLAAYLPARRASRLDPMVALRTE
jgi:predicted permease